MMDLQSRAGLIGLSPLFAALDDSQLRRLAEVAAIRQHRKGQLVFLEGDAADSMYVVVSGSLKIVSTSEDGQELVLAVVGPKETFGEMAIADDGARSASVQAITDSVLLRLPVADVLQRSEETPAILRVVLKSLATVVRRLTGTAADLVFLDLPRRVVKYLLRQAEIRETELIDLELTQGELAQHLGSSRQSLNSTLRALDRRGWISSVGHRIKIRDAAALRRFVGD